MVKKCLFCDQNVKHKSRTYCSQKCWGAATQKGKKFPRRGGRPRVERNESPLNKKERHNLRYTREYVSWTKMRLRCRTLSRYIKLGVYEHWHDPVVFIDYLREHLGPHPGKGWSLDRIDNELGYFPGNIRWATAKMQANNRIQRNQWTRQRL